MAVSNVFTIDIHTHILPQHIPDFKKKFGYKGFIQLNHHKPCCAKMIMDDVFFREVEENCWSPEKRIQECNHNNIDVQVLSTVPVMFSYWAKAEDALVVSQFINDHLADIVNRYPKKFVGLGNLPMHNSSLAIKEIYRCKEIGLRGIQIGSHINNWNLEKEELFPIYEACESLNLALFVHPWWWMGKEKTPKYWLSWLAGMPYETSVAICSMIFGGIFKKYPKLRVAFAHGGGAFPGTIGRIEHGFKVRPDLCAIDNNTNPKEYLGHFYLDSLVHDQKMLEYIIDLVGADRVALGSDYPFPLGELKPGSMINKMDFPINTKKHLLHGSALSWLDMKKSDFE